jgi:hypothetical protein
VFYQYWNSSEAVTVSADATSNFRFAPRFGALAITGSHPEISFELRRGGTARIWIPAYSPQPWLVCLKTMVMSYARSEKKISRKQPSP